MSAHRGAETEGCIKMLSPKSKFHPKELTFATLLAILEFIEESVRNSCGEAEHVRLEVWRDINIILLVKVRLQF